MNSQSEAIANIIRYIDHAVTRGVFNLATTKEILETIAVFEQPDSDKTEAFRKLVGYVDAGFLRGAYNLADAQQISQLFSLFISPPTEVLKDTSADAPQEKDVEVEFVTI
jgi:hypothetical protein